MKITLAMTFITLLPTQGTIQMPFFGQRMAHIAANHLMLLTQNNAVTQIVRCRGVQIVPECPKCGDDMVKRRNASSGEEFWGCVMYPYCDGTVSINEPPAHPGYPDWAKDPNG